SQSGLGRLHSGRIGHNVASKPESLLTATAFRLVRFPETRKILWAIDYDCLAPVFDSFQVESTRRNDRMRAPERMFGRELFERIIREQPLHEVAKSLVEFFSPAAGLREKEAALIHVSLDEPLFDVRETRRLVAVEIHDGRLQQFL